MEEEKLNKRQLRHCNWKRAVAILTMAAVFFTGICNFNFMKLHADSTITYLGKVKYGGSTVGHFMADGQTVFCIEHEKNSPSTGTSFHDEVYHDENMRKALYYGWGGAEQWGGFESEAHGIVATSLVLSHYYSGTSVKSACRSFYDFLQTAPGAPDNSISISKNYVESYVEGNVQRTEDITLGGDSRNTVTFPLPDGVELHNIISGAVGCGNVEVRCGETFYLTAPFSLNGVMSTGNVKGNLPLYQPVIKITGNDSIQNLMGLEATYDPLNSINLSVKWEALGKCQIQKIDSRTGQGVANAQFGVYSDSGCTNLLETLTTDGNGATITTDMVVGTYYLKETKAPEGYVRNQMVYPFTIQPGETIGCTVANTMVTGTLYIQKVDKETGTAEPQGDAVIEGAVYGLYAKENIVHPDGHTGVLYPKDSLVTCLTVDKNGQASVSDLYLGEYYLKEITAPEGYVLDTTTYDVNISYEGENVSVVTRSSTVKEQVIKQPFCLIKVADMVKGGELPLLQGAGFSAYLKSDLQMKENGTYDYKNATPVPLGENGETIIYTDERGYLESIPLPYGTYVVVESVTPEDKYTVEPFEVIVKEHKPDTPQTWKIFMDETFKARLKIIKEDTESHQPILLANAEFKIYDMDNQKYVSQYTYYPKKVKHTSFKTDETGTLMLPEQLQVGRYRIEEVNPPEGYLLNHNYVEIKIGMKQAYEVDEETNDIIITAEYEDTPVTGELIIKKQGDVLKGMGGSLYAGIKDRKFSYQEEYLAGAEYEVRAAENIYTPDNQKDEDGNRQIIYKKGDLVNTVTTDKDGKAVLKDLPLGTYRIQEIKAPEGYILNDEEQKVTFAYVDGKTPVVKETVTFTNERQKVSLSVLKTDSKDKTPLAGAEFALYAGEDIKNNEGKIIVKKDTLLDTVTTDKDGKAVFREDLPFGTYRIQETKAPEGYVLEDKGQIVTVTYADGKTKVVEKKANFTNERQKISLSVLKTDSEDKTPLAGAEFALYAGEDIKNNEGKIIVKKDTLLDTVTTDEDGKAVFREDLLFGTYRIQETKAPEGYVLEDKEQIVTITYKDGKAKVVKEKVNFTNEKQKISLSVLKTDSEDKTPLAGAEFALYAGEDIKDNEGEIIVKKDTLLDTVTTNENGEAVFCDNLLHGTYYARETKAPEGYIMSEKQVVYRANYQMPEEKVLEFSAEVPNKKEEKQSPKTGDFSEWMKEKGIPSWVVLAGTGLLFAGAGVTIVFATRKKKK